MQYLKESVRNNILESARNEFYQYGYRKASLREIAAKSGITVGNIYRYFSNKEDLLGEVLAPLWRVNDAIGGDLPSPENLDKTMEQVMDFIRENYKELKIMAREPVAPAIRDTVTRSIQEVMVREMESDPGLAKIIAGTFIQSFFLIIRDNEDDMDKTQRYLRKLITIFFITGKEAGLYKD